ncbi:MAG: EamA family transporter [Clostridia bacterium]|nr:EamA family transporter [Clostridia bacterium]
MGVLLIILNQITHQGEGMIVRRYGKKYGAGGMLFNAILCLFSAVFFIVTDKGGLVFTKELVSYGLVSCILFATGFYAMYLALSMGSFAMTRLINSFSGLISIFYGIIFLSEGASLLKWIAIALVFVSAFFMRYQKKSENDTSQFSLMWLIFVLLSAVSNGFIAVLQRMQQLRFDRAYDNEFMIISLVGAAVILLVLGLIKEKEKVVSTVKYGSLYGLFAGMLNGATNFTNLAIYLFIPISAATPIKTGLGLVTSFLISIFIYKEKFTKMQFISAVIGVGALILFKLA